MAEAIISPGVFTRENDQSFLSQQPVQAGAAIIGPTVKGPVETPIVVTSYSDYKNKFGATFESGSATKAQSYTFLTSIAAYNYFQNGGDTLLVTRVVNGTFSEATATVSAPDAEAVFELATQGKGTVFNNSGTENADGTLVNGTRDNVRWEIVNRDTSSGTFSLAIRRGDDRTNSKTVLETYSNISLDPYSDNYIEKAIGNQVLTKMSDSDGLPFLQLSGSYNNRSNYVYVKTVNQSTPNYFDNSGVAKNALTGSIPALSSGSLANAEGSVTFGNAGNAYYQDISSGTNIQGLQGTDYSDAIKLLKNRDAYQFNSLIVPGLLSSMTDGGAPAALTDIASLAIERGDFLGVLDMVAYGGTNLNNVTSEAGTYDNSYLATYWPWCQVQDPDCGKNVWVPASTLLPGVFAFNDNNAEPWFAPAGLNRGALSTVLRTERILTKNDRDVLYSGKVNPIATFPNAGVVVFGQKTLQQRASALDRVNVRRLLIQLKGFIGQLAQNLVFEQNTIATRNSFLSQVNPYLETVQQRQGLYAFRVVMDDSNNTPDVVDRNQLVGQIFLQPTKTAEFIVLDFNVLPTGAEFPA